MRISALVPAMVGASILGACAGDPAVGSADAAAVDVVASDVVAVDVVASDVVASDVVAPPDLPPEDLGPRCGAGQVVCDGLCVSPSTDRAHCGACGVQCAAGRLCIDGVCTPTCPAGQAICAVAVDGGSEGRCFDLGSDEQHCGTCDTRCAAGELCVGGACTGTCPGGQTRCDGACVDLARDRAHCGACGTACSAGEVCVDARCAASCGAGLSACGGRCVSLANDPAHCGACDQACPTRDRATSVCAAGACAFVCGEGFADCDRDPSNGCEVALATSVEHCGACGARCASTTGTAACSAGRCELTACVSGRGNCDGDASNGCEVDTSASRAHCGACGNACAPAASCVDGVCEVVGASCAAILAAAPSSPSGLYLIDPDGAGPQVGFRAYCEMVIEGGGWTLLATITNSGDSANQGNWRVSAPTPNNWESDTASFGVADPARNEDFRSPAFHRVAGRALMITHRNAFLLRTDDACLANVPLRDRFASLGWTCGGSASFASHPACTNSCVIARATPRSGDTAMLNGAVRARLYLKAGEADGAQDSNRDRVYLSTDYRDNVDYPTGLGAFCSGSSCTPRTGDADVNDRSDAITPSAPTEFYGVWVR